jgi:biotin carboxylase
VAGLYISTLVWSLGEIIGAPTFFSYPARIAPEGLRGRYLGASGAMMSLAFAIGPAVGTPLWSAMGSSFWLVCGLVCAVAVAAVYVGVLPSDRLPVAESENAVPADQKTLLLVASSANPDLLRTPRDLGLSIVIAAKNPPADTDLYDVHLSVDEMSEEAVAQAVSAFVASGRRIDAVACFHEGSLRAAARVAADLGLPGNTPEAVMNMRDKAQTIDVLTAAGIGCPRSRLVTSADEAVAAAAEFGLPVVVKPQSSASSQGVTKAKDEGALRHAYEMVAGIHKRTEFRQGEYAVRNISTVYMDPERRGVLVQELLSGPEFALDFVYADGEFFLLGIHDKPSEWEGDAFIETVYITPSGLDSSRQQLIVDTAVRGLRAVGATTGGAHVEIRLTEDGPKIIEINGRLGGTTAYVQESIQASTGVWGPREYLRAVLGERPQVAPAKENAGFVALLAGRTGRIAGFQGASEVLAIPGVKGIRWLSKPGDDVVIEYPANPVSCFALALATGQTRQEVLQALALAEQTLVPVME